jgi:hypothetical protein
MVLDYRRNNGSADLPRRRRAAIIVIPTLLMIVTVLIAREVHIYVRFRQRLRMADQHAPIVRKALQNDGRFSDVCVESFTGYRGSFVRSHHSTRQCGLTTKAPYQKLAET